MKVMLERFDNKYYATDFGEVFSLKGTEKNIIGKVNNAGYREILISHNGNRTYLLVHILIAKLFVPNPLNKRTVNHKDGNKLNNNYKNLEWNTDSENLIHARDNNLLKCKISMEVADEIRASTESHRKLALRYNIGKTQIGYIKQYKRWKKK